MYESSDRVITMLQYVAPLIVLGIFYYLGVDQLIPERITNRKDTGERVEEMSRLILENTLHRPVLRSVLFGTDYGLTSETDLIQVSEKGIVAVECKYRNGEVHGSARDEIWEVRRGQITQTMPNTIRQNHFHIEAMKKYLEEKGIDAENLPIYNISVIYGYGKKLQAKDIKNPRVRVFDTWNDLVCLEDLPDVLSETQIQQIHRLLQAKKGTEEQLRAHVEKLKEKYE